MSSKRPVGAYIAGALAFILFIIWPLARWAATVWTDVLWYQDLGQESVFWTRWVSQLATAAAFAAVAFIFLYANARIARRNAPLEVAAEPVVMDPASPLAAWQDIITRARERARPIIDRGVLWGSLLFAFVSGLNQASEWQLYRLAVAGGTFGYNDPAFGRDVGFFVFRLPALQDLNAWLAGLVVFTTVVTAVLYLIEGAIGLVRGSADFRPTFAPHVKAHISVLAAAFVLSRAFQYWLDVYKLSYSPRGQVTGASYTDVHAQLPADRILIVISIATAILLLFNIRQRGWRLPAIALGTWVAASLLLGLAWPALMQQFIVKPNEFAYEEPYIKRNLDFTRRAYDLTSLEIQLFPAREDLTAAEVATDSPTISNVRLWDPQVILQSYTQLQALRQYYDFADADVDRYTIEGETRQMLVAAREMDSNRLSEQAQTWVNRHLVYTHGYGLVMSPANAADSRGIPDFIVGDVPPRTDVAELRTREGRIYFGELENDYIVVNTGIKEFDYPRGQENAYYEYEGEEGIAVGNLAKRAAWAMRFNTTQILFSRYITPASRVLFARDINTRVNRLAPWLVVEDDPYPALIDGRIVWIIDGYTSSAWFPYSESSGEANYVRNPVKVTMDAYTGETRFYAVDPDEPILKAWGRIFPTLLTSADNLPDEVRAHFRYPQGFFETQAEIYKTYHMTDPRVFYNKEDLWEVPGAREGAPMEPFYVNIQTPGSSEVAFELIQPYTPRNRDNLIGWVAASSDPDTYGQRTVYQFPKERVVLGPAQVSARINQDAEISPQLSLWSQRGSQVIFGNMLILPIGDSIVYVQPLYLQAEQTAIPELTRIIVAYADRVSMKATLTAALADVFGAPVAEEPPSTPGTGTPEAVDAAELDRVYQAALAAQRDGDWAEYGARIKELGELISRLASEGATATP